MKNSRLGCAIAALVLVGGALAAQDSQKPASDEVAFVVSVSFDPPLNRQFYSAYDLKDQQGSAPSFEIVTEGKNRKDRAALGKMVDLKARMDQDRSVLIYGFIAYPSSCHDVHVLLPVQATVAVPKGTNYVYLGSISYSFSDDSFTIDSISLADDFDAAKAYVKKAFGDAAAAVLVRVPLKPRYSADKEDEE